MRARFEAMWGVLCGEPPAANIFGDLERAYGEPHRRYHTLEHIADCLEGFDPGDCLQPDFVECAIWFHDVVYDTKQFDNEEQSAEWAARVLREGGASTAACDRVAALIVATKQHEVENDSDAALLLDIDLSILGRDAEAFDVYDQQIREEYTWVPDEQYAAARRAVLQDFLDRPRIYHTPGFTHLEAQARENLRRVLQHL